ncbi:MAG TPA: hypothetical protein VJ731_17735 [Terriglobales bacterium]|nr:hypothetical protein [Terriglobales bacterium]
MPVVEVDAPELPGLHFESTGNVGSAPDHSRAILRATLYAGAVATVLGSLPLGPGFMLALPLAGFLAVLFFRRWTRGPEPRPKQGFKLGALAGVFAFVGCLALAAIRTVTQHDQNEMRNAIVQMVQQQQARAADPQTRQALESLLSPEGMAMVIVFGFVFVGIVFVLLSGAGGAISASLLRRKGPPAQ